MADDVRNTQFGTENIYDSGSTQARNSQFGVDENTKQIAGIRHSHFGVEDKYDVPGDVHMTQFGVEFLHVIPVTVASGEKCDVYFVGF